MKNWPTKLLGEISESIMGQAPPGDACNFEGVGTPFVKAGEFGNGRPIIREWTTKPLKFAKSTDVLVCVVGATCGKLNLGADCAIGRSVAAIRPNPSLLNQGFLYAFLQGWTLILRSGSQGSAQGVITRDMLASIPIPVPPLAEQERIVKLLDEADELRKLRAQADTRTADLIPALFHEMFGVPLADALPFPVKRIGDLVRDGDKINYGVVQPGDEMTNGIPIVRAGDFSGMTIDKTHLKRISPEIEKSYSRSRLRGDEILISCVGSIGSVALADSSLTGCNIVRAVARVPLRDDIDRVFVANQLMTPELQNFFRRETRTVAQPTLNIRQIEETPIILPPLPLQKEFAQRVTEIRELEAAQTTSRQRLESLFQSMLHRAFNGEI